MRAGAAFQGGHSHGHSQEDLVRASIKVLAMLPSTSRPSIGADGNTVLPKRGHISMLRDLLQTAVEG